MQGKIRETFNTVAEGYDTHQYVYRQRLKDTAGWTGRLRKRLLCICNLNEPLWLHFIKVGSEI